MKPLNLDNRPCSPISSNCVIWQGPDITCIKLCTGECGANEHAKLHYVGCPIHRVVSGGWMQCGDIVRYI